mmetsp:Transcript_6662/g.8792  ORF Transcript_6662/g.8792 Transcript_6662/m.8792 type:complete len:125 (-) Transcript_6662:48-422(-)
MSRKANTVIAAVLLLLHCILSTTRHRISEIPSSTHILRVARRCLLTKCRVLLCPCRHKLLSTKLTELLRLTTDRLHHPLSERLLLHNKRVSFSSFVFPVSFSKKLPTRCIEALSESNIVLLLNL